MLPFIQLGPLSLQLSGLLLLLALWIGLEQAEKHAKKFEILPNALYTLAFVSLMVGVIGARLVYIVRFPQAFSSNILSIFALDAGMLDGEGGVLTGILAGFIYLQRKQMPAWSTLDALAPGLAVLMVGIGLAHVASGQAYGLPTRLPWGIYLWGASGHPTQIYETLLALAAAIGIWPADRGRLFQMARQERPGALFLIFVIFSATSRIFVEAFRGDSVLLFGTFHLAQVLAWAIVAVCLLLLGRRQIQAPTSETKIQAGEKGE